MKKMLFVMNPYAGQRRANRYLADILSIFNRAGYRVEAYMTGARGEATDIVRQYAPEMDLVACCGGDGTFNETVNGLLHSGADIPVGYIPAGSTNDFAASLGLPTNILQAAETVVTGEPSTLDVGKFGDRYFSYVASFGAFTRTSYATPQSVKNALGHAAYILGGISELSQLRTEHVKLQLDDEMVEDDFLFGAVSNSTSVGGVLSLDPKQVDLRDGKFEVLLLRSPRELGELSECIRAVQTAEYNCKMLTFTPASRITIWADAGMPWTLDGEMEPGPRGSDHRKYPLRTESDVQAMLNTTLCYITRGDQVLMLHRVKKENDLNHDKWIGVGGKFLEGESPDDCLLRETKEETGLTLTRWQCRGVVTFLSDQWEGEYMYLFTADGFTGSEIECNEGDLQWVSRAFLNRLPKWEGDAIFLDLLWKNAPFFLLTLRYEGEKLVEAVLNGERIRG